MDYSKSKKGRERTPGEKCRFMQITCKACIHLTFFLAGKIPLLEKEGEKITILIIRAKTLR